MKILLIVGSFPPMIDSVGDYTSRLAETLAQDPSNKIAVLTSKEASPAAAPEGIEVLPCVSSWSLSEAPLVLREIRRWNPDLVHLQFPSGRNANRLLSTAILLYLRATGVAVVQTWHFVGDTKESFRTMPLSFLSFWSVPCAVFVVNRNYLRWSEGWLGILLRHKTMRFLPNGSAIPSVELEEAERLEYRRRYAAPQKMVIAYFGFLYPGKGVEQLFEIADASKSHIVLVGGLLTREDLRLLPKAKQQEFLAYSDAIKQLANSDDWSGRVTITGFLPPHEVGAVLRAADAVVLPYSDGCKSWNTCLYAAQAQGTFVLTTSHERSGYDANENTYYARPNDVASMKAALEQYSEMRGQEGVRADGGWGLLRELHLEVYRTQLIPRAPG
jgi:glycosyltransferase involved in cell wall biosynthesis